MLLASADGDGVIIRTLTMEGLAISAGGQQFADGEPRSEAEGDGSLQKLRDFDLVKDVGYKGEVFKVNSNRLLPFWGNWNQKSDRMGLCT